MRNLYEEWLNDLDPSTEPELVEPPPPGLDTMTELHRDFCMEHPTSGVRFNVPSDRINQLRRQGWRLRVGPDDFLEMVHLQSWYFQVRFFPRLTWALLWSPPGEPFVLSDRPVLWQADGFINVPPAALRHPTAQVVAPLSPLVALFGFVQREGRPEQISPRYINLLSAASAERWVFGATFEAVSEALELRAAAER
jgi:hypothetical protein